MEEKKRVRPTWAMVRELEEKLREQIDGTSRLVADCDGWRDKYRALLVECDKVSDRNTELCKEIDRLREERNEAEFELESLRKQTERLEKRGLFARMLNTKH